MRNVRNNSKLRIWKKIETVENNEGYLKVSQINQTRINNL